MGATSAPSTLTEKKIDEPVADLPSSQLRQDQQLVLDAWEEIVQAGWGTLEVVLQNNGTKVMVVPKKPKKFQRLPTGDWVPVVD